jgi:hypothetical protein
MTEPKIVGMPAGYAPDAAAIAEKRVDLFEGTPLAGLLPEFTQVATVGRDGNVLGVAFAPTPVSPAVETARAVADADEAAVAYRNMLDELRRDGWTVRELDPWDYPDPLRSDAEAPF